MEALLKQQTVSVQVIERALPNFKKLGRGNWNVANTNNRLEQLKEVWRQCTERHAQLLQLRGDEAQVDYPYFDEDVFGATEEKFLVTTDFMCEVLMSMQPAQRQVTAPVAASSTSTIQDLPAIELPKFIGNYREWESFRDLFKSMIIDRVDLTDARRMYYLVSCLSGVASNCVSALPITDASFPIAWKALQDRYENKRKLIQVQLDALFGMKKLVSGTADEMRALVDTVSICIKSLANLGRPVNHWGDLIVYRVARCLDSATRHAWELKLGDSTEYPSYDAMQKFLEARVRALENYDDAPSQCEKRDKRDSRASKPVRAHVCASGSTVDKCTMCSGSHFLASCSVFKTKTPSQRFAMVKQENRCINCLSKKHTTNACSSKYTCRTCQKKHHTLLHFEANTAKNASPVEPEASADEDKAQISAHLATKPSCHRRKILLATAWVRVCCASGCEQRVRALLDQGSEATFISRSLAQSLRVERYRVHVAMTGIGESCAGVVTFAAPIQIKSCDRSDQVFSTDAFILRSLTKYAHVGEYQPDKWTHLDGIQLADPPYLQSEPIQIIIGADLYVSILLDGIKRGGNQQPSAQNTIFGWVLSGPTAAPDLQALPRIRVHLANKHENLDRQLCRFWECEEIPMHASMAPDEQKCEDHFRSTHSRTAEGRYVVRLPFKTSLPIDIGDSKQRAASMLARQNRRLAATPDIASLYDDFLNEYLRLGHMEPISLADSTAPQSLYIPHQAVHRESRPDVKIRVVFNASCATSNGTSLNDHLLVGPKLQTDLSAVLLRWRQWRFVYSCDIAKMYRQIRVDLRDADFQRILWRPPCADRVQEFRLLTVTYGTAPAAYLAIRVLRQLVCDEGSKHPLATQIILQNSYVDDCLFGANNIEDANSLREEVSALLAKGGFDLHKWASNCSALLGDVRPEGQADSSKVVRADDSSRILGIQWHSDRDQFRFEVRPCDKFPSTKRTILSAIAQLYDPLGWATPVTIVAKQFMQQLWLHRHGWDDQLPPELLKKWQAFYFELPQLNDLYLDRWIGLGDEASEPQLHGFCDASNVTYAAVVYLRVALTSGGFRSSLLAAKSKVAPLKTISVPRLELSAALLLSRLIVFVRSALNFDGASCHCWSDSTVALAWINRPPSTWKTFVANRVAAIQALVPDGNWHHVPTKDNPADCGSRGLTVDEFSSHELWWHGPPWLLSPPDTWPKLSPPLDADGLFERKDISVHTLVRFVPWDLATRHSNWLHLLRITAYVMRFCLACKEGRSVLAASRALQGDEVARAEKYWLSYVQREAFDAEIATLRGGRPVATKSALAALYPFLGDDGLMRVGGRLGNAPVPYETRHPTILRSHPIVALLMRHTHVRLLHAGLQLTLASLRARYWIVRARQVVRAELHKCVQCARERASMSSQLMGSLPKVRVTPASRAFQHCGVDYAGPILIRNSSGRGRTSHKAYISLFICLTTRAVHLELVNDYSASAFIAALNRFCARRGLPQEMYSVNGTNFKGADKELSLAYRAVIRDPDVGNRLASDRINWRFIPPSAPHFGGMWEAGVRSVKYHLRRVVGPHTLTYEEFITLLTQVEACLNSRPLAPLSDCSDDYDALTPGHFLIGSAITTVPEPSTLELAANRLKRWTLVRKMYESFWERWASEYAHLLRSRGKWRFEKDNVQAGDMVLLRNSLLPPCKWALGRIVRCIYGPDGLVRVARVRTAKSEFTRPIGQLCLLPNN